MPRSNTAVLILPDFEEGVKLASEAILQPSLFLGWRRVLLKGGRALRQYYESAVNDSDPILVMGAGHGKSDAYSGQWKKIILEVGWDDTVEDRCVFLLSCLTARELGPYLVRKGARCFIGFDQPFLFASTGKGGPYSDPVSFYFFEPVGKLVSGMMGGLKVEEAFEVSRNDFKSMMLILAKSGEQWAPHMIALLLNDESSYRLLGDRDARLGRGIKLGKWVVGALGLGAGALTYMLTKNVVAGVGAGLGSMILAYKLLFTV